MSSTPTTLGAWAPENAVRATAAGQLRDWIILAKPKIAVMVVVAVAAAGAIASLGSAPLSVLGSAMLGALLLSASASAMNQWREMSLDALMARTRNRPLAAGRLSGAWVVAVSLAALLAGSVFLWIYTTPAAAIWGVFTWVVYVLIYTPLKVRSVWNTAVGAVAGAAPLLLGWTAVDGVLGVRGWSLFLLLFLWQFPHFMAIAWIYRKQYASAGMRMQSVDDPRGVRTAAQAVLGAAALLPISCLPIASFLTSGGMACGVGVLVLGLLQFAASIHFLARRDDASARLLLRASLVYLPAVLLLLVLQPLV